MASTHKLFTLTLFLFVMSIASNTTVATLSLPPMSHRGGEMLAARLKLDGGRESNTNNCWDSLFHLQACTGEVISFFLNGETSLGPGCCRAITVVGHDCWPEMLPSLGFTVQEASILLGYCDDEEMRSPKASSSAHVENHDITP